MFPEVLTLAEASPMHFKFAFRNLSESIISPGIAGRGFCAIALAAHPGAWSGLTSEHLARATLKAMSTAITLWLVCVRLVIILVIFETEKFFSKQFLYAATPGTK